MDTELKARHNLPSQPTSFIGRENEIAEIVALLDNPACRLLTLVGPGGSGKTRLAIEAVQQVEPDDGMFFVPLQPLSSAENIVTTIIDVLPLQLHGEADPQQQLLDYLRERHMLLILDNFEHLLDGVNIVTGTLDAAPNVNLLVTSREALNLQAEYLWQKLFSPFLSIPFHIRRMLDCNINTGLSQNAVRKFEPHFLVLDALLYGEGAMTSLEPVDGDVFAQAAQVLLVDFHLAGGAAGVVASLDDEHRRADVVHVGDWRTGAVLLREFVGCAAEK
jgi:hypothetical protein